MMRTGLKLLGTKIEETAIIGDRMDTDIISGVEAEIETILVLSGVTTLDHCGAISLPSHLYFKGRGRSRKELKSGRRKVQSGREFCSVASGRRGKERGPREEPTSIRPPVCGKLRINTGLRYAKLHPVRELHVPLPHPRPVQAERPHPLSWNKSAIRSAPVSSVRISQAQSIASI